MRPGAEMGSRQQYDCQAISPALLDSRRSRSFPTRPDRRRRAEQGVERVLPVRRRPAENAEVSDVLRRADWCARAQPAVASLVGRR